MIPGGKKEVRVPAAQLLASQSDEIGLQRISQAAKTGVISDLDAVNLMGLADDHQLDLSPGAVPREDLSFRAPKNDPDLANGLIPFSRSLYDPRTGTDKKNPRQQVNVNSSYMDSSNVYGSSCERATLLRRLDGTGKLKSTPSKHGDLPPLNTMGLENDQGPRRMNHDPALFFVAEG